ncbi:hypothetical protein KAU37_03965 [Candidatus Bipolaricaulota bacterium]|nr:hypothetical protein [Candidatus Bipolaricaulota bacterium]
MAPSKKPTAEILFVRNPEYRVYPATGAWGGLSANKEVNVDFYIEARQNPDKLLLDFEDGKQVGERREPDPQPFLREMLFRVVMRPDIARSVGEFLVSLADKADKGAEEL